MGYDYQGSKCHKIAGNMQLVRKHREVVEGYVYPRGEVDGDIVGAI